MEKSLAGMKIVNFGDSIFGKSRPPKDISTFIEEYTGAETYNIGFGGCRMSDDFPYPHFNRFSMYQLAEAVAKNDYSLQDEAFLLDPLDEALPEYFTEALDTLKGIDFSKADTIITIAYGTNDYTAAKRLEGDGKYDITSFGGALRYSIEKIREAYPDLNIVICSQTYRYWRENGIAVSDSNTRVIGGRTLVDFVKKTEEIAREYGLFYIDNYYGPVINESNRDICFSETDGTHPLVPGLKLVAKNISNELIKRFGR